MSEPRRPRRPSARRARTSEGSTEPESSAATQVAQRGPEEPSQAAATVKPRAATRAKKRLAKGASAAKAMPDNARPDQARPENATSERAGARAASARATGAKKRAAPRAASVASPAPTSAPAASAEPARKRPSAKRPARAPQPPASSPRAPEERSSQAAASAETAPAPQKRPSAMRSGLTPPRGVQRTVQPPAPVTAPRDVAVEPPRPPAEPNPIYDIQEKVDRLLEEADSITGDPRARRRAAEALTELAARLGGYDGDAALLPDDEGLFDGARGLLSSEYYLRQWGRLAMRHRSDEVDAFGLDRTYESRFLPLLDLLYQRWFRVVARGVTNVPPVGRGLIVANHGGALPWDALMVRTALRLEHPDQRASRWLAEDFSYHMPFLGAFMTRMGAARACPENAERLLVDDELLTVFPEGIKGVGKLYRDRYRLQRFGRGGYVKLALRTGSPIIPAGIVGAEETYPLLFESNRLARLLGVPFLPVTPLFPWLGPLGLLPLPSRWVICFGEPIELGEHGPDAASDSLLVAQINDQVRARVEELVGDALAARPSTWS